jgi:hypothetical protein
VNLIDQFPFDVALETFDIQSPLSPHGDQSAINLRQTGLTINLLLPFTQQVQVGTVQNKHLRHPITSPLPPVIVPQNYGKGEQEEESLLLTGNIHAFRKRPVERYSRFHRKIPPINEGTGKIKGYEPSIQIIV